MKKKKRVVRTVPLLVRGVPEHIRDSFRAFCVRRGMTMKDRLIELMTQDANLDHKEMKKIKRIYKDVANDEDE